MKGRSFNFSVIVLIVSLFFSISCQAKLFEKKEKARETKQPAATKSEVNQPAATPVSKARIQFDNTSHDFGTIAPDTKNNCKFSFKNVGQDVLKIDRLQGTCKCTVPDLQKKDYAPGESGEVTVEFHAPKYKGETSQHITVYSNDAETPRAELEIKANIMPAVEAAPDILNLSLIDANSGAVQIALTSGDNERFAVTKITSTGNVISFKFDPNNISDKHILKPVVNTANLRSNLTGYVIFTLNHPKCREIRAQWSCLKEFEASPSVIILRNAVAGDVQKRSIYLTSNYNEPIVIESITSDKGIIKVTNQQQTENRLQFDVDITPPAREKQLRVFSDTLHINIKGKDEISIPCRGFYKAG